MGDVVIGGLIGFVAGVAAWWLVSRLQLTALQTQVDHARSREAQMESLMGELRRKLAELELQLRQAALVEPASPVVPTRSPAGLEGSTAQAEPGDSRLRQLEDELAQARQRVTLLQAQLATVKGRLPRLEDDIVQARQRAAVAEATAQERRAQMKAVQERAETAQGQLEQAAERIYQLEQELARAQSHPEDQPGQPLARKAERTIASSSPGIEFPVGTRLPRLPRLVAEEQIGVAGETVAVPDEATARLPVESEVAKVPQPLELSEEAEDLSPPPLKLSEEVEDLSPQPLELSDELEDVTPPADVKAYCVKCKAKRLMRDPKWVLLANERPAWKGTCPECGSTMFRFVKGARS
jgi:phage shock protein A